VIRGLIGISGYLPAEHIETPTERLARLNKHRNIDVSYLLIVALLEANFVAHIYHAGRSRSED
jgi:hypothetical protein